ncbi:tryptophan--tRNA ligase [Caldisericum exile]|uniref:Tryptophan--tRNA ligase n=1 Tax=Caldisericum exile (strain DSM 21853 / NBRC 104410 / AZM16c01) TaxID=511051 RepID=A0A7U6JED8_CALEA|nr:tryptophan--tRNA ligase [Caldisericum exile]BAL80616.1 tryptophanyl-tRNA synthetase [Caldisericum exile AZM16c01]
MDVVVTGMRSTGELHIGHLVGVIDNLKKLQETYKSYFFIADLHVLTTNYEHTEDFKKNRVSVMLDWLASGVDPNKATLFIQSKVPAHTYLHLLLSMIVPVSWLERNPTVKEMIRDLDLKENASYGLLGYPVLMASDIILYKAKYVPVGKDQLPHLEMTREMVRRFNYLYGELFVEPQALLTEFPYVPGIDGKKMSKSLENDIKISDTEEDTTKKIMKAVTDPQKIKLHDKGHPEVCNVFTYHKIFNKEEVNDIERECRSGELGCVACKRNLANKLNEYLRPIREKREQLKNEIDKVEDIFEEGSKAASLVANATLEEALTKMNLK